MTGVGLCQRQYEKYEDRGGRGADEKQPEHETVEDESQQAPFRNDVLHLLLGAMSVQIESEMTRY